MFRVEISYKTIIFSIAFLLGLWLIYYIRDVIILVFLSVIFLTALLKPVNWLNSRGIPRVLSIIIVYLVLIAVMSFILGTIIPPFVAQTQDFASRLPQIIEGIDDSPIFSNFSTERLARILEGQVDRIGSNVFAITSAIFSSVFLILTLFVLTFYLLLEWRSFIKLLASPFSGKQEKKIISVLNKVEIGLGQWVRGQVALSVIVGVLTFIGLTLIGIPYALPLAIIAGILEIIPIIGPIISAIPAILIAVTVNPILGLAVAALFFIIQQLENHLLVPMVMSRVIGVQPPVVIIALLVGARLAGISGAFLAVPLIVVSKIIIKEILFEERKMEEDLEGDD